LHASSFFRARIDGSHGFRADQTIGVGLECLQAVEAALVFEKVANGSTARHTKEHPFSFAQLITECKQNLTRVVGRKVFGIVGDGRHPISPEEREIEL
jgi:hypothetical protein